MYNSLEFLCTYMYVFVFCVFVFVFVVFFFQSEADQNLTVRSIEEVAKKSALVPKRTAVTSFVWSFHSLTNSQCCVYYYCGVLLLLCVYYYYCGVLLWCLQVCVVYYYCGVLLWCLPFVLLCCLPFVLLCCLLLLWCLFIYLIFGCCVICWLLWVVTVVFAGNCRLQSLLLFVCSVEHWNKIIWKLFKND